MDVMTVPRDGAPLRVELYGVARSRAGCDAVLLYLAEGATLGDALAALAAEIPALVGPVLSADRRGLAAGSIVSFDGKGFTRDPAEPIPRGGPLLLMPASSGG